AERFDGVVDFIKDSPFTSIDALSKALCSTHAKLCRIIQRCLNSLSGFYISDGTGYGPNQIEGKFISTGQSYEVSGIECGKTYTLKVVRTDAEEIIQKDVPIHCGFDYLWEVK
ncbi:MAG: hypothetical protein LRY66_16540, partial [Saccharospirillaceae bacterium]|nr:hypothetical protein [Saccharospirillaceae bacterium]MCD8532914.1 hypothetical protein [Saccharospirillaceae bacterium]